MRRRRSERWHVPPRARALSGRRRSIPWGRWLLTGIVLGWFAMLILVPTITLLREALSGGFRLTSLGGLVRVELTLHDGSELLVQLTRDRSRELSLAAGEAIFVAPKDMKVFHESQRFVENYVI